MEAEDPIVDSEEAALGDAMGHPLPAHPEGRELLEPHQLLLLGPDASHPVVDLAPSGGNGNCRLPLLPLGGVHTS